MEQFMQQLLTALTIGSIYALIALGYTMTYGIIKLINFAHGDIYMFGAYMGYIAINVLGLSFMPALLFSIVTTGILGYLIERIAYRPLRGSSRISALITTIGVSLLIRYSIIYFFTNEPKTIREVTVLPSITLGNITITGHQLLIFLCTIVTLVLLQYIVTKTKLGRAMRAVSTDYEAASLMGINVNRVISITFVIGTVLAALAGVLISVYYTRIIPTMGVTRGLKAFIAAVFGGIGLFPGAVLGGFFIGIVETLAVIFGISMWGEALVYLILIVILIIKPSGILGKKGGEKV